MDISKRRTIECRLIIYCCDIAERGCRGFNIVPASALASQFLGSLASSQKTNLQEFANNIIVKCQLFLRSRINRATALKERCGKSDRQVRCNMQQVLSVIAQLFHIGMDEKITAGELCLRIFIFLVSADLNYILNAFFTSFTIFLNLYLPL